MPKNVNFLPTVLTVLLAFAWLASFHIELPGLYMDSVNPDYMSIYMDQPPGKIPAWLFTDNLFVPGFRRPLLNSLYGLALPAYTITPFADLFGWSAELVRGVHLLYGALIVALFFGLIFVVTESLAFAGLVSLAVALDPTFVFAWRTQYFLQLFPLISFIPACLLLTQAVVDGRDGGLFWGNRVFWAGLFAGVSAALYFVFAFYAFSLFVALLIAQRAQGRRALLRTGAFYCAAFAIGWSPFIFAHLSIIVQVGWPEYLADLRRLQDTYGLIKGQSGDLGARLSLFWMWFKYVPDGSVLGPMLFGNYLNDGSPTTPFQAAAHFKLGPIVAVGSLILTAVGLLFGAGLAAAAPDKTATRSRFMLGNCVAIFLGHLLLALLIGRPLAFQHYIMLLFPIYCGSALGLWILVHRISRGRTVAQGALVALPLALVTLETPRIVSIYQELIRTGGSGDYSDAINHMGEFARSLPPETTLLFSQWGFWMGVTIITGGDHPIIAENSVEDLVRRYRQLQGPRRYAVFFKASQKGPEADRFFAETELKRGETRMFADRLNREIGFVTLAEQP